MRTDLPKKLKKQNFKLYRVGSISGCYHILYLSKFNTVSVSIYNFGYLVMCTDTISANLKNALFQLMQARLI
jgi:hypothetical protein